LDIYHPSGVYLGNLHDRVRFGIKMTAVWVDRDCRGQRPRSHRAIWWSNVLGTEYMCISGRGFTFPHKDCNVFLWNRNFGKQNPPRPGPLSSWRRKTVSTGTGVYACTQPQGFLDHIRPILWISKGQPRPGRNAVWFLSFIRNFRQIMLIPGRPKWINHQIKSLPHNLVRLRVRSWKIWSSAQFDYVFTER